MQSPRRRHGLALAGALAIVACAGFAQAQEGTAGTGTERNREREAASPPAPGGDPTGACCLPTGGCQGDLTEAECTVLFGAWEMGLSCVAASCEYACCLPGGCVLRTLDDCLAASGTWFIDEDCTDVDCIGICCLSDDTCDLLTEADCDDQFGDFRGIGIPCWDGSSDPGVLCRATGACCLPDDQAPTGVVCMNDMNEEDCRLADGVFHGWLSTCTEVGSLCVGACCMLDADTCTFDCVVVGLRECEADGGFWQGEGTTCDGADCLTIEQIHSFDFIPGGDFNVGDYRRFDAAGLPIKLEAVEIEVDGGGLIPAPRVIIDITYQNLSDFAAGNVTAAISDSASIEGLPLLFPDCGFNPFEQLALVNDAVILEPLIIPPTKWAVGGPVAFPGVPFAFATMADACLDDFTVGPRPATWVFDLASESDITFNGPGKFDNQNRPHRFQGRIIVRYTFSTSSVCCLCDGTCIDNLTEEECQAEELYQEWIDCTTCADYEPDCMPRGACCLCNGTCIPRLTEAECQAEELYQSWGECLDCDPNPCEPRGACCLCDGTCVPRLTLEECTMHPMGQEWYECMDCADIATVCVPRGACCLCDGTCIPRLTEAECMEEELYQSWGECLDCDPNPCEAKGACCLCDGTCIDRLTSQQCDDQAMQMTGRPPISWSECTDCDDLDPPCEAIGACCLCDGTCSDGLTEPECTDLAMNQTGRPYQSWTECTLCSDLDPPCEASGRCCVESGGMATCYDGVDPVTGDLVSGDPTADPLRQDDCLMEGGCFEACKECDNGDDPCGFGACCFGLVCEERSRLCCEQEGGSFVGVGTDCTPNPCVPTGCAGQRGSLVLWHKVELRWDSAGNLIQNTFLNLTNDHDSSAVRMQLFFVNGDEPIPAQGNERAHPGWNFYDNSFVITKNQPLWWNVATGESSIGWLSPFWVLDPHDEEEGELPGRPAMDGTSDRVLRGFVYGWAVNDAKAQIKWNKLTGTGTIVYYAGTHAAWEYVSCTFPVVDESIMEGQQVGPTAGELLLDGQHYAAPADQLIVHFQGVGSQAYSAFEHPVGGDPVVIGDAVVSDTDLTLHPIDADFRFDVPGEPVTTQAQFKIRNENRMQFATSRCITCWDQQLLSLYENPSVFDVNGVLQTDQAYCRINGLASPLCDVEDELGNPIVTSRATALAGLVIRHLRFGQEALPSAMSEMELVNVSVDPNPSVIRYSIHGGPPPEAPGNPEGLAGDEWSPWNPFEDADRLIRRLLHEAGVRTVGADDGTGHPN